MKKKKSFYKWGKYLIVIGITLLMFLFYRSVERVPLLADDNMVFVKAVVVQNDHEDEQAQASLDSGDTQQVVLEIRSGAHKGEKVDAYSLNGYLYGANCKVGTKVIASLSEYDGMLSANVYNYDREAAIAVLLAVFFGLMWLVGGKKGFNSILALIFTFVAVIMMYIPMMYIGVSPFIAATITVVIITLVTFILIADFQMKSIGAMLGTIFGVIVSGLIALVFGHFGHVTGFNVDDIENLIYVGQPLEFDEVHFLSELKKLEIAASEESRDVKKIVSGIVSTYHIREEDKERDEEMYEELLSLGKASHEEPVVEDR